jgi:hypothetical protein
VALRAVLTKRDDTDAVKQGAEQRTTGGRTARRVQPLTERCCAVMAGTRPGILAELGTEAYVIPSLLDVPILEVFLFGLDRQGPQTPPTPIRSGKVRLRQ